MIRDISLHTLEGVSDARITLHPVTTEDGLGLYAHRFLREPGKDVVVLIHGLTTSTDMFIQPEHVNLVSYLLDHGFGDVWTLDYRMSNRLPYNMQRHRYNLDDIALFDFPALFGKVREVVGPEPRLHVICHCLGSVSFMMSLFSKTLTDIASVISNSASLEVHVPTWSRLKLWVAPFVIESVLDLPYIDPGWSETPGLHKGKLFSKVVSAFHRECDVPACHMLSVMWGTGHPALFSHSQLADATHRRSRDLYGATGLHYYRHVRAIVENRNSARKLEPGNLDYDRLPDDYWQYAGEIRTPVLFVTGRDNNVFSDSNVRAFERIDRLAPGRHQLQIFDGYGHQDVFMGHRVHEDVFPRFLRFLEEVVRRPMRRNEVSAVAAAE